MASGNDIKAATRTYDRFIAAVKWSVPIIAVITLIIIVLISS